MRVLFHIPKETLEGALRCYRLLRTDVTNRELDELMMTLDQIFKDGRVPDVNPQWPVGYNDACDVVSNLQDQLNDALDEIERLKRGLWDEVAP